MSICKLCGKEYSEDIDSHIVSKFFCNKIKTLGGIRQNGNVNKRLQDGLKVQFLCGNCEELFSGYETYFANNVYNKLFVDDSFKISIDKKIRYFLLSLHWRNLHYFIERSEEFPDTSQLSDIEVTKLKSISEKWRKQLLKEKHFCIFFGNNLIKKVINIDSDQIIMMKEGWIVANDIKVYGKEDSFDEAYSIIAVPKLLIAKRLWNKTTNNALSNSKKNKKTDEKFVIFLEELDKTFIKENRNLSDKQRKKIEQRAKKMSPPL